MKITFQRMSQDPKMGTCPVQGFGFFPNGYGVSIVSHNYSYGGRNGLLELAILIGDEDHWEICYDTPITHDVIGNLTIQDALEIAEKVAELPATEGVQA